ncbi:MAG TPA: AAA family ATPase [Terracidiphilus sp.]|nr:AAA family ATPase [Terracidiphilus sp.]
MLETINSRDAGPRSVQDTGSLGTSVLSAVLIGPDQRRRDIVAEALADTPCHLAGQISAYPDLDSISRINLDVIIIDLDSNPEYALELVESICAASPATVMVYSASFDSEVMLRCMRAGAREFLKIPLPPSALAEAIVRASARRSAQPVPRKTEGSMHVFCGAKGGVGVTTIATNFAVAATLDAGQKVLLLDLDLPLGDTALQLGLTSQYSIIDALQNSARMDANFLSRLVTKHDSGLFVLSAPGSFVSYEFSAESINKLLQVARREFDFVVIDAGCRFNFGDAPVFDAEATVYLVSHVGVAELRNSNRIVSELFRAPLPKVEIVMNCYSPTTLGMDEEHIKRALTREVQWRIPEDRNTVREMQSTATPLAMNDSPVSRAIRKMARTACGITGEPEKKKKSFLGLF